MDEFVGDVRSVILGRVNVVDAQLDRPPQYGERLVPVTRRSHDAASGQLHGAEPDAMNRETSQGEGVHHSTIAAKAYGQSKLANYHFALGLQREFERAGVTAQRLMAHPPVKLPVFRPGADGAIAILWQVSERETGIPMRIER